MLAQMLELLVGMGAGDDAEAGLELPRLLHDVAAFEGIGDRHDQAARGRQIGGGKQFGIGGVAGSAVQRGDAAQARRRQRSEVWNEARAGGIPLSHRERVVHLATAVSIRPDL